MFRVDLNCDMGESYGSYKIGMDEDILHYVTSANIACGFHAGDANTMRKTIQLCAEKNIGIGAHPGYPDLNGFGRRKMDLCPEEVYNLVVYQVGALQGFAATKGVDIHHVKPHGALYNTAAKNRSIAEAIAQAVADIDSNIILFGLSGSELVKAGEAKGLQTASEVFADRTYQSDGSLTSRKEENALIEDDHEAVQQVIRMVKENKVTTVQGDEIEIKADTVCIHGDGPHALSFAEKINQELKKQNIYINTI